MILYKGNLFDSAEQDRILSEMEPYINHTLTKKSLSAETVIAAIDALGREIAAENKMRFLPRSHQTLPCSINCWRLPCFPVKIWNGNYKQSWAALRPQIINLLFAVK